MVAAPLSRPLAQHHAHVADYVCIRMVGTSDLLGGAELVGAAGVVIATFTVGGFSSDPLPWRILAVFMAVEGVDKLSIIGE